MARVKRGVAAHARHKKVLKLAKGYRGRSNAAFRVAIEKVEKGLQYAYRDRRNKKRAFRGLWIQRINAATREHGMTYSQFMNGILKAGIEMDRKVMADLATREPAAFKALVDQAQAALKSSSARHARLADIAKREPGPQAPFFRVRFREWERWTIFRRFAVRRSKPSRPPPTWQRSRLRAWPCSARRAASPAS